MYKYIFQHLTATRQHHLASMRKLNLGGRRDRVTIVMEDFYSSVGEEEEADVVGNFGYGRRNEKGQLLVDYCKEKKVRYKKHVWSAGEEEKTYMV